MREHGADHERPHDHPHRRRIGAVAVLGAEHPPHDHLAGDRDGIEDQRQKEEELGCDLVRAELRVAHARAHRSRDEERCVQRRGANEDLSTDADHRAHLTQARALALRVRPQQLDREGDAHAGLRDCGSGRGALDPPVEDVHEEHLEDDVHEVRNDDDLERAAHARDAAEIALARQRDQRSGQPDRRDPEVREGVVA